MRPQPEEGMTTASITSAKGWTLRMAMGEGPPSCPTISLFVGNRCQGSGGSGTGLFFGVSEGTTRQSTVDLALLHPDSRPRRHGFLPRNDRPWHGTLLSERVAINPEAAANVPAKVRAERLRRLFPSEPPPPISTKSHNYGPASAPARDDCRRFPGLGRRHAARHFESSISTRSSATI